MSSDTNSHHHPRHIKEMVIMTRLNLYNHNLCCGAKCIRKKLQAEGIRPLPSLSMINRILARHGLTHRRMGLYNEH